VTDDRPWAPVPLARGTRGAVVAPHHLAAAAGLATLRAGGTAVDAAIATNAVLGVVMPWACGIGGDAFWLIWDAATGRQLALNGSGRAAAGADPVAIRAAGHGSMPRRGPLPITVPGAVRSWGDAHARLGRLSPATILGPAIDLAGDGFAASARYADEVEGATASIADALGPGAGFFEVYRPAGRAPRPGGRVRLPALAATLATIADEGFDTFYDGDLGTRQVAGLGSAGSVIAAADLTGHASTWGEPLAGTYRGVQVTTHPPNSSGIVALEILAILSRFEPPPASAFGPDGVTDPRWIHLGIEAAKLAMADRDDWLADPDASIDQVERLLDPAYLDDLAARIDPRQAFVPTPPPGPPGGGTVFVGVVDAEGTAVSLIESNWSDFGSGVVDAATGIVYHNRGNAFCLDQDHANVLAPRKRPRHTLLPGMLFRPGAADPWIVAGSMGGDAQPQIHAQFVSAVVDGGLDIRSAVTAPRWFVGPTGAPAPLVEVRLEARHQPAVAAALVASGHVVTPARPFDSGLGEEHAIELVAGGPAAPDGSLAAATDPRSEGLPAVW
jgi:gamma-glutamyltranspeptidase